jgi:hypothetical protein
MTNRRWHVALLALPILLGGCAGAQAEPMAADHSMGNVATNHEDQHGGQPTTGDAPPERAAMVCDDEISGEITQILQLDAPAHTVTAWDGQVFTCTYHLPMGPLVLSVNVSDSDDQAGAFFDARAAELPQAEQTAGLGERAVRTDTGVVVVVKDDMTLTVDATGLPEVFGANGQRRTALAFEVASDILGCWTEHE